MEYTCFDKKSMQYLGTCRLPDKKVDPPGTGHSFGRLCYTLQDTDAENGIMYFRLDVVQPYLDE